MEDIYLTIKELANYLKVKQSTVYNWINHDRIPVSKVVGQWRFRRSEIDDWVKNNNSRHHGQINGQKTENSGRFSFGDDRPFVAERQERQKRYIEKRRYPRLNKLLPVKLILPDAQSKTGLSCEAIAHNISKGGMFIELNSSDILSVDLKQGKNLINLEINLAEENIKINAIVDVVWRKKQEGLENRLALGTQFKEVSEINRLSDYISDLLKEQEIGISRVIERELPVKSDADNLPKFTLLVDGEDVDTGVYRYYPFAEKEITEPQKTTETILHLKKMKIAQAYCKEYIFAKSCVGNEEISQRAIQSAYRAFKIFRKFSLNRRRKIIEDIVDLIAANREILIELLIAEGHTRNLAEWQLMGIERTCNKRSLDFYKAEMWKDWREGDELIYLIRKADGVVCLSPPKNAPASNSVLAIMTFLAGNTLIVKPPIRNPISTIYLWRNIVYEALRRNGAPKGTLNIILGNSKKIMDGWLNSPLVNDIIFFGESDTGLDVASRAFTKGKKAILELTGNDMLFVWKDAPINEAVNAFLDCFLGSTQICMVPKKAIIHEDIYDKFVSLFVERVKKLNVGLPGEYKTNLTPVVKIDEFFVFLKDALKKGAKLLYGGERVDYSGKIDENGIFIKPAIVLVDDRQAKDMLCIKEENYFPLIPLIKVGLQSSHPDKDKIIFEKMVELANSNQYGLRISIWVCSDIYVKKFMEEINNSGLLRINSRHIGFSSYLSSHGGTGRTGGPYGGMNYIWLKTSHLQGISKFDIRQNCSNEK